MQTYARQLGDFAAGLRLSEIPAEVVTRAKGLILDGLGCGLFGVNLEWTRILREVVNELEPQGGAASIWGGQATASAASAALVNGTMIQGYELDDANPATIHSCAVVLPAVLAIADQVGTDKVSGERLLTAVIAGFEVGPRIGLCMNGNKVLARGWHAPGVFGPFPAAVSAAVVLGLDAPQVAHAMGIAGAQAGGLMSAQFGSMVKRMLCGWASQKGVLGALLAARGFTGIEDIFEQEYGGFCTTFADSPEQFDRSALTDGLHERWETMRIAFKRHACVGTNMAALDAIEAIVREHGVTIGDIDKVLVRLVKDGVLHSYWTPYEPAGLTAAQMHLGFCIATMLTEGEVFVDQMVEANIGRPDLVEFANRVTVVRDEEREKKGRAFARGAVVEIKLKSGQVIVRTEDYYQGSYMRPLTSEQMSAKYRRLALKSLPETSVQEIEDIVWNLEEAASITRLANVLKGVPA